MNTGGIRVKVRCPKCGHDFKQKVRELKRSGTVACPHCRGSSKIKRIPSRGQDEGAEDYAGRLRRRLKRDLT